MQQTTFEPLSASPLFGSIYHNIMKTQQTNETLKFMSYKTLAARWEVSSETLKRWRHSGKIPSVNFGKSVRFPIEAILKLEETGFQADD